MKRLILAVSSAVASCAFAVDGVWTGPDNGGAWNDVANWSEAGGGAASSVPTTLSDTATFPAPSGYANDNVVTVGDSLNGEVFQVGTITGTDRTTLSLYASDSNPQGDTRYDDYDQQLNWRFCELYGVSGFLGWWSTGGTRTGIRVHPAAGQETLLANLSTKNRPGVSVPADGKARINVTGGGGVLHKVGAGELAVDVFAENDGGRASLKEGTLTLSGASSDGDDAASVLAGAYLHLDATVVSSRLTKEESFMGRTLTVVTNWCDCRGAAAPAGTPHAIKGRGSRASCIPESWVHCPFLTEVNGLPMVDFGAVKASSVSSLGPTNCVMSLSSAITNVREVFYVAQRTDTAALSQFCALGGSDYGAESAWLPDGHYYDFATDASRLLGNVSQECLRLGDVAINGVKRTWSTTQTFLPLTRNGSGDVYVFSAASAKDVAFVILGSDRYYRESTGGGRLGELIVFTNALTRLERARINKYLLRKWRADDASLAADLGTLIARSDSAAVSVPANRTASVRDVAVVGTKLVKDGAGRLEVGNLQPATATVEIRGGSVAYARTAAPVDDSALAANPAVHLDATSADGRFVFEPEGGTNFVSQWKDDRTDSSKVAKVNAASPHKPFIVESAAPTGLRAVSFGKGAATGSFMDITYVAAYEGFIVCRLDSPSSCSAIFGSSSATFMRDTNTSAGQKMLVFGRNGAINGTALSALWTVNGVPRDPIENVGIAWSSSDFYVISFSSDTPCSPDMLGLARPRSWGEEPPGYITVGEFVTYNRRLDDAERRNTIAYLMKKWLGKDHPEKVARTTLPKTTYAADVPVTFDVADDVAAGEVSGGDGTLVKRGVGTLTVTELEANYTSLSVEGGTLSIGALVPNDDSLFHFDASSADSFVTNENGVQTWNDVRGNGVKATYNKVYYTKAQPTLVDYEMPDGVSRRVVDFGAISSEDSGSLDMSRRFTNVREAHIVFMQADNSGATRPQLLTDSDTYHYLRGGWNSKALSDSASKYPPVFYGRGWTNGCEFAKAGDVPVANNAFRLYSFAPTNVSAIGTICRDRNCSSGGAKVAELIGFSENLPDDRRNYLMASMMHKWFGTPEPVFTNALESLSVAADATLSVGGKAALVPTSLSGAGTVSATAVIGVEELTLDGPLTVVGELALASSGTITIRSGFDLTKAGSHLLVSATNLTDVDLSAWTLVATTKRGYSLSLRQLGNGLYVHVTKPGAAIVIR